MHQGEQTRSSSFFAFTGLHFDGLKPVLLSLRLKVVAELVLFLWFLMVVMLVLSLPSSSLQ